MLVELLRLYAFRPGVRTITWIGLGCAAILFLFLPAGSPLQTLWLLLQTLFALPSAWSIQGAGVLLSLAWPLLGVSFWCMFFCCSWVLLRHHYRAHLLKVQLQKQIWQPFRRETLAISSASASAARITEPLIHFPHRETQPLTGYPAPQASLRSPAQERAIADIPTRPVSDVSSPVQKPGVETYPLSVGVGWHTGIVRRSEPNEDSLVVLQGLCTYAERLLPFGLFCLADGMGGHAGGREASRVAIQSMMHTVLQNILLSNELSDEFLTDMLIGGVEWANGAVYQRVQAQEQRMGTTLTAALILSGKAYIVNVGDSRAYLFREGSGLTQITYDHSLVSSLVTLGQISPDDIYTHPERHKIYRCVGAQEQIKVDWFVVDLEAGDRLLLCSDGLWEMVRDRMLERVLHVCKNAPEASDYLLKAALHNGGADNVSVLVVDVP